MKTTYADIILPLATPPLTFSVGEQLLENVGVGSRVMVQLGPRKYYAGIVLRLHQNQPDFKRIKAIEQLIDPIPVATSAQLKLWEWLAEYYMCPIGMVMRAALPAGLKLQGYTHQESLDSGEKARTVPHLTLHSTIRSEAELNARFESLKRSKAQYRALVDYVDQAQPLDFELPKVVARACIHTSTTILQALIDKEILQRTAVERSRMDQEQDDPNALPTLSPAQHTAYSEIEHHFRKKEIVLLQGVTGSGKTEIYIHLIAEQLLQDKQVLYLLPEIALTTQLIERLKRYFGNRVEVYHSGLTNVRRSECYRSMLSAQGGRLLVGVRSSVMLPISKLGLVIIDEEHETSFKQSDGAPRYHARDTALVWARLHGAKTLLGSATPSLESYFNAVRGKYGHVLLNERYSGVGLPHVVISDTLRAAKRGEKRSHFNKVLLDGITDCLANGKQVMLFQNRRGFSPYVECGGCGWRATCPDCNVTLTYHKVEGELRCHYCGCHLPMPPECPSCHRPQIETRGFGTEKVEEELALIFPEARIERLDGDTARSQTNYRKIISSFENGNTDILIGTQMITKGFDFGNVALVGIMNADNLLNFPDFRACERAFQVMMQVGGRAGRRAERGLVVIQTSQPAHPVLGQVIAGDYEGMASSQLAERQAFGYPPFCRMIVITLRHRDLLLLQKAAQFFERDARTLFGRRLLGPEPPPVDRIRGEHLVEFMLKIELTQSVQYAKRLLEEAFDRLHETGKFRYVELLIDVDPQ